MADRLRGRVCVVAGVLGTLGEAVARRFTDEGGVVVGIDRTHHEVGRLSLTADLSQEAEVKATYERIWSEFGRLDVIYNNAGMIDRDDRSALDVSLEVWTRVLAGRQPHHDLAELQARYPVDALKRPGARLRDQHGFVSGGDGLGVRSDGLQCRQGRRRAARARPRRATRAQRRSRERAGAGPDRNAAASQVFERIGPEEAQRRFEHMPLGRFGTVEELAATAAYLASDEAGFVTASAFPLNGGIAGAYTAPSGPVQHGAG